MADSFYLPRLLRPRKPELLLGHVRLPLQKPEHPLGLLVEQERVHRLPQKPERQLELLVEPPLEQEHVRLPPQKPEHPLGLLVERPLEQEHVHPLRLSQEQVQGHPLVQ